MLNMIRALALVLLLVVVSGCLGAPEPRPPSSPVQRVLEGLPRFPVAPFLASPRDFAAALVRHLPPGLLGFKCLPRTDSKRIVYARCRPCLVEVLDSTVALLQPDDSRPFARQKSVVALRGEKHNFTIQRPPLSFR